MNISHGSNYATTNNVTYIHSKQYVIMCVIFRISRTQYHHKALSLVREQNCEISFDTETLAPQKETLMMQVMKFSQCYH